MADTAYERLSAQDSSFLLFETPTTHMHLGGTTIFEVGPLATPAGGVDIDRIRRYVGSRLHWIPRYRQKLRFIPVEGHPVWVDDDRLNLHYHVRHTSLPKPGNEKQLKDLSARILSQQLDRGKPLWEVWIVEGLEGGRFAMIVKTHHCVVDGISGVGLMSVLLNPTADDSIQPPPEWRPRPAPSGAELMRDALLHRVAQGAQIGRAARDLLDTSKRARSRVTENLATAWEMITEGLKQPAPTPLNQPIGHYRRFDWKAFPLEQAKEIKNRLGGSLNDVVLTIVAGAVREFLAHREALFRRLDYRAVVPVSVRASEEQGTGGNRVSAWLLSLPVSQPDALRRYQTVRRTTERLKKTNQAKGIEILTQLAELSTPILTLGVGLAARMNPYNLIVTNVPGPQTPLYLLGAPMIEGFPHVPLFENQGLAVALFSYNGRLCWGFNADWDLLPDLDVFVAAVERAFCDLHRAATTNDRRPAAAKRPRPVNAATGATRVADTAARR
jgi:WS/DGAT/MGAT family acyltransferase